MVEYTFRLDTIFGALADPIRRDILDRVSRYEHSVSELVICYDVSFAAISKHLKVLEEARLIHKRKDGRKHMVSAQPAALAEASEYLQQYRMGKTEQFDRLDDYLNGGNV